MNSSPKLTASCDLCPHFCKLDEGQTGFCKARKNQAGQIVSLSYGKWLSISLDPIEKKPLRCFYPGRQILSVGTFGCNMACPFCQNYTLSRAGGGDYPTYDLSPQELVDLALREKSRGNIGLAFTYNEPLINYECVLETAALARENDLETVMVSAGQINKSYLEKLLPYISAWNIDLKCFTEEGYKKLGGDLHTTLQTIRLASNVSHVEITTLVVPGLSDDLTAFRKEVDFLASINPDIALHLSRYFPAYRYKEAPTRVSLLKDMQKIAQEKLGHVFLGNV